MPHQPVSRPAPQNFFCRSSTHSAGNHCDGRTLKMYLGGMVQMTLSARMTRSGS
jgi:hypothetical protein